MSDRPADFCYELGRAMFRRGEDMPARPEEHEPIVSSKGKIWLGYMVQRGLSIHRQELLRRHFEEGGPFPNSHA